MKGLSKLLVPVIITGLSLGNIAKAETTFEAGLNYTFGAKNPVGYFVGVNETTNKFKENTTSTKTQKDPELGGTHRTITTTKITEFKYNGNSSVGIGYEEQVGGNLGLNGLSINASSYNKNDLGGKVGIKPFDLKNSNIRLGHENLGVNYNGNFGLTTSFSNNSKKKSPTTTTNSNKVQICGGGAVWDGVHCI